MEGVSRGFKKKFDRFPGNYGNYPEPLPLPPWVFEEEPIPPVTVPAVPEDLAQALAQLKTPLKRLLEAKEAIDKVWPKVYPVLRKYSVSPPNQLNNLIILYPLPECLLRQKKIAIATRFSSPTFTDM